MATKIYMRVTKRGIAPDNQTYAKMFGDLGMTLGQQFWCTITKPRNQKHHAKFFAWLHPAFEAQGEFTDVERFRYWVIMTAGFYEETLFSKPLILTAEFINDLRKDSDNLFFLTNQQGLCGGYRKPKSLKFSKMDQQEFTATYDAVCAVLMQHFNFSVEDWGQSKRSEKLQEAEYGVQKNI